MRLFLFSVLSVFSKQKTVCLI